VWLFTREFGLVIAMVQGVRKPTAKLQNHITDYAVVAADLIKGKNTWRLISAKSIATPLHGRERTPMARAYVRTVTFLERFLIGEGIHEELFDHIVASGELVTDDSIEARVFDALSLWKMLVLLGYIAVEDSDEMLFTLPLTESVKSIDDAKIKELIKQATTAITNSHL
jgi:recombinational DNA repair protein (RecF pathway)